MKILAILAVVLASLFTGLNLQAGTVNLEWTAAVQRTDGTLFDMPTEGLGYHLWINDVQEMETDGTTPVLLSVGQNTLTRTLPPGNVCFNLTTVPKQGAESELSEQKCKIIYAQAGAPSSLIITITP